MNSAMLMTQAISQNIAVFFGALFAGGSIYISLVEDPATAEGGVQMAGAYLLTAHPRPAIIQTIFAGAGALAGLLAGFAGGTVWWFAGGGVLAIALILQVSKVVPIVRAVADAGSDAEAGWLNRQLTKLARLHAALSLAGLAALFAFVMKS